MLMDFSPHGSVADLEGNFEKKPLSLPFEMNMKM
jgi:hypothetical protein